MGQDLPVTEDKAEHGSAATEPVEESAAITIPPSPCSPLFTPSPSSRPLTPGSPVMGKVNVDLEDADELSNAGGVSGSVFMLPVIMSRSAYNT
jgi:hypothetical protein